MASNSGDDKQGSNEAGTKDASADETADGDASTSDGG
eukprot:SAG31_NODE_42449_length_271_cov_1.191860_1_plen_36_part_01